MATNLDAVSNVPIVVGTVDHSRRKPKDALLNLVQCV